MEKNKLKLGKWFKWAVFDDFGMLCGIREDAPDEAKRSYNQFVESRNELKKNDEKA